MRIVVSGGGTAGHIAPALATCDALRSLDSSTELLYIGQADGMEAKIVAARGIRFEGIRAGKFRRNHFASSAAKVLNPATLGPNLRDAARTVAGVSDSLRILRRFKPDVLFLKGGFVCVPVGIAARLLRLPYVIHESDVSPGLANRTLGKSASKIAVGFPVKSYHDFDPSKLVFTGSPIREEILHGHALEARVKFKLSDKLPVVFVTGGSGGAQQINQVVVKALPRLVEFCQVIHLTGENQFERVKFEVGRLGSFEHADRYHPFGFLMGDMGPALAAADVVVARAGANTIAELAALKKPTVFIPNYEMAGHQVENARLLSRAGAARVLDGSKLDADGFVRELSKLLSDPVEQERLSEGIAKYAVPGAAEELAGLILSVGREHESKHLPNMAENDDEPADGGGEE